MTSGDDGRYEVPVVALPGTRSSAWRARFVAVGVIAVVGGAVGLAVVSGSGPDRGPTPANPPTLTTVANTERSPAPDASAAYGPVRSVQPRVESLFAFPNEALRGAPHVDLLVRSGDDITVERWEPGSPPSTIPGSTAGNALAGTSSGGVDVVAAPGERRYVVFSAGASDAVGDAARVVDTERHVLWEGEAIEAASGAIWSADGSRVILAGADGTWRIVTIDGSAHATERSIGLPDAIYGTAAGVAAGTARRPRTVPLGWSADDALAYGGVVSPQLGSVVATFRVAVASGRAVPVASLGVGRAGGLVPRPDTLAARLVDPTEGWIANWRNNSNTSGGPTTVEVRKPDQTLAFMVTDESPVGSAWGPDGSLYVVSADIPVFPGATRLVRYDRSGAASAPILRTGPLAAIDLIGIAGDYAILATSVRRPVAAAQLVVVDLGAPDRASAVTLDVETMSNVIGISVGP